jgi:molybdopterin synthase sulfur carrier subunit
MITILYFARLREAVGTASEQVELPRVGATLADLRAILVSRGGAWSEELRENRRIRAAVNQAMADDITPLADGDEVAFFPPVTGG